jgi:DNA-binding transcriptional LysR family regulator
MWEAIELQELRVFLVVAQELHFGRAAERLLMNRSRVSQIIKTLEARVGGRLFDRTSRQVRLTPLGKRLRAETSAPYGELQNALASVHQAATGVAGTLRVGMYMRASAGPHMVEIVRTFETRHPGADVAFIDTGLNRSYLHALRARDIDLLAIRLPLNEPDITIGPVLACEERVLVVGEHDPLAGRESVCLEDFADRPVSDVPWFPRETIDALVPPETPSGQRLPRVVNRTVDELMMRVLLGEQVHPTVSSFLDYFAHPGLRSVPIRGLPPSLSALAWLSSSNRSPKIRAFANAAEHVLVRTELARHQ